MDLELPLLVEKGLYVHGKSMSVTAGCNGITIHCNAGRRWSSSGKDSAEDMTVNGQNNLEPVVSNTISGEKLLSGPGRIRTNDPRHVKAVS